MSDQLQIPGIYLPGPSRGDRATQVGSKKHLTGGIVRGDGPGNRNGVESHHEMCGVWILGARQDTIDLVTQVRFDWIDHLDKPSKHFIDIVVTQRDGKVVGYAVRPGARVSRRYLTELAHIKEQAIDAGFLDDFRLFTELDICPIELFNAKLFHGVRTKESEADEIAAAVVRRMDGVSTLERLVAQTGLHGVGFRALVRLVRAGVLKMVRYERLSYDSLVFAAAAI